MIITQHLITSAGKNLTRSATRYLGKEILYKDLLASIARLSYLYQHEIGAGVRMAFVSRNSPAMIATMFAMTNTRSLVIPIDPDLPPADIANWLKESKATHVAVSSDLAPNVKELLAHERLNLPVIEIEKKQGGEYDTSYTAPPEHTPKETDPVLLLRTGGTTAKPKYIAFNHKQVIAAATAIRGQYHLLGTDRFLTTMSWAHPFAFVHGMLAPLMLGATCVIDHGLQNVEFLDFMVESRVTRTIGTPQFYLKMLIVCKNEKRVLPGLKSAVIGLGSLSPELNRAFDLLKVNATHVYGMAENLWTIAMQDATNPNGDIPFERGFVGKGLPGMKYKVVDDQGDEVESKGKRTGQLAVSSPSRMDAYMDKEKETKQAIRGTWLYTGDVATLDGENEELRITFVGRKADMLSVNGQPVNFHQMDLALKSHPAVQDAAAFMIKDGRDKSVIACAVVRKAGATLNEKQVMEFIAAKITNAPPPVAIAFTDQVPRDGGGNVNYSKLRGQFSGIAG